MSGVVKIDIVQPEETLKVLLLKAVEVQEKEKLQVLYWLKTKTVDSVSAIAVLLGRHRTTVYSPEVNPIERLWEYIKEQLKWQTFDNLQDLRNSIQKILSQLSHQVIASLTGWQFILEALSVAGI